MPRITEAKASQNYKLFIRFEDGASGEVDLSDLVGQGVFDSWRDPAQFAQVSIDAVAGTVCWPGGIDLCPDQLYHDVTGAPLPGEAISSTPRV